MSTQLSDGQVWEVPLPETIPQLDPNDFGPFRGMVPEKIGERVVTGERWLVEGLVPMDGTTMISGAPESGKSLIALGLVAGFAMAATARTVANDSRRKPPR